MAQLGIIAVALCAVFASSAFAEPHLGMKLACKRYGDAYRLGDRAQLMAASTPRFAQIWARMSNEMLAQLPKPTADPTILKTQKSRHGGEVSIATPDGVIVMQLEGQGFQWKLSDILRKGPDGDWISTCTYLDITLTVRDFMTKLKGNGGHSFHDSITREFRDAFVHLTDKQLQTVRAFLPPIEPKGQPMIKLSGDVACMTLAMPGGHAGECVRFALHHQQSWKVHDYTVSTKSVSIPSFRQALPIIASVGAFQEYVQARGKICPTCFAAPGPFCDALRELRASNDFPLESKTGSRIEFRISDAADKVTVRYPDRCVQLCVSTQPECRGRIETLRVGQGAKWVDVGALLVFRQRMSAGATAVTQLSSWLKGSKQAEPIQASTLELSGQRDSVLAEPVSTRTTKSTQP